MVAKLSWALLGFNYVYTHVKIIASECCIINEILYTKIDSLKS